jgi:DNA ligase D-like protein (predicted 3'-phosphoesterase)
MVPITDCFQPLTGTMEAMAQLGEYRRKRNPDRTSEPIPESDSSVAGTGNTFVIQEHHATALHWDFRLERDGVLVSWAIPKGLPPDPKVNHLAVHTEDHPLEYASFAGNITEGEYGGGRVDIWDHGTYELEKWTDREVKVVLSGQRAQGRFVLIHTGGKQWLIHRMDAPARPDWVALPDVLAPMLASSAPRLPTPRSAWAFEMNWAGQRATVRVDGGRVRVAAADGGDITADHRGLRQLGARAGTTQLMLDGEFVRFDDASAPDTYLIYDLTHCDGRSLLERPYRERRRQLDALGLAGPGWQTPPAFLGDAPAAVAASAELGLDGVVAKRLTSAYTPGVSSSDWRVFQGAR